VAAVLISLVQRRICEPEHCSRSTFGEARTDCDSATRITKSLLGYGVLAGPFYVVLVLIQSAIRPGFNLTRDDVSLLSNGSLGWVQIGNFVLTGLMIAAYAVGLKRALASGPGSVWGPRLLAVFGAGRVLAGIFVADPMNGFPAGAPAGRPTSVSVHGMLHLTFAGIGFLAFVTCCALFARRFALRGERVWAYFSGLTAAGFLAGFARLASGSSSPAVVIGFWVALLVAWGWLGAISLKTYRQVAVGMPSERGNQR
jgi:hypothetical protein